MGAADLVLAADTLACTVMMDLVQAFSSRLRGWSGDRSAVCHCSLSDERETCREVEELR